MSAGGLIPRHPPTIPFIHRLKAALDPSFEECRRFVSGQGRGYIFAMPRRPMDTPAKLARRMKRRWRVVLLRAKGEILGEVEAPDVPAAKLPQRSSLI